MESKWHSGGWQEIEGATAWNVYGKGCPEIWEQYPDRTLQKS